jgi:tripartite-type tricarboxylate transporter receptor subunit TctC
MRTTVRKSQAPSRWLPRRGNERRLVTQHPRRQFLHLAAGAAALPAVSRIARAQAYPTRPITMVVSFAAGGTADVIARILAERMRTSMGQPIIVENIGGANGTIGIGRVARAAPDGYTLSMGSWTTHVVNGAIYPLQYDTFRDFEPISLISTQPALVVAKKAMPANDLKGLIAWLKANPDKASSGTSGVGSPAHVIGILFQNITRTRFQFVPYRGGGPAIQDLVAGQFDLMFASAGDSLEQVRGGSIKAFAVMAESRLASAPNIPTVDEAGLPGFYHTVWSGLWAPRGTSKNVIDKLNTAVVEALADDSVRARLASLGQEIYSRQHQTPEALRALQKAEIEKWWPIIKAAGIRAQ